MEETFEQKIRRAFVAIQGIKIPDMPEEVIALDKEISSRYPNTGKMVEIISGNTMLAAELLKIANSPSMRPRQPIKSIAQAVSLLGVKNLKNMLISAALRQIFGTPITLREMMDHSADVALCAAELANHVHGIDPDEAYMCALFHNCGAILLTVKNQDVYRKLFISSHTQPLTTITKEESLFNTNHMVTGLLLAKKWQLDEDIIQAIYQHHIEKCDSIENERARLLVALLKVANGIVAEISLGTYIGSEMKNYMEDGINTLLLTPEYLREARLTLQNSG
jgi:putative nucleotidyltransferase with HDIG domain